MDWLEFAQEELGCETDEAVGVNIDDDLTTRKRKGKK